MYENCTYGNVATHLKGNVSNNQHKGFGKRLLGIAEWIAFIYSHNILINSGVGVRLLKLGYKLNKIIIWKRRN